MRRILLFALVLASCQEAPQPLGTAGPGDPDLARSSTAEAVLATIQVQDRHTDELMSRPGVVGVGTRLTPGGQPAIVVYTADAGVPDRARIPARIEGVPVAIEVTGRLHTRDVSNPTTKERPAPVGFSVGHPSITAGTIGARVKDASGNVYILSNNHVIANSNNANVGDATLQPGPYDGGRDPADRIGTLHDFQPIAWGSNTNNQMDAAIARVNGADLNGATPSYAYGPPSENTAAARLNQSVQKFGRTTGLTKGTVAELNLTVSVCYSGVIFCTRSARFVDQIGISPGTFSAGGDSGSLIVTDDASRNAIGLLFAGGSTRTIASLIDPVLTRFGVTIDPGSGGSSPPPDPDPDEPDPTEPDPEELTLSVLAYKERGLQKADLSWAGATSSQVDVFRGTAKIATTNNSGSYTDHIDGRGGGSYLYRVCEAGTQSCSNTATASF